MLAVVALVLAGLLVWTHRPHHAKTPAQTKPNPVLYGQHATVTVLGAVLTAPLCSSVGIPAGACSKLQQTVSFTDPESKHVIAKTSTRGTRFTVQVHLTLGHNYQVQAKTTWGGKSYESQVNDFALGRPTAISRILLSY